jgi:hypothetical protein
MAPPVFGTSSTAHGPLCSRTRSVISTPILYAPEPSRSDILNLVGDKTA